jgi:hypothetical protein
VKSVGMSVVVSGVVARRGRGDCGGGVIIGEVVGLMEVVSVVVRCRCCEWDVVGSVLEGRWLCSRWALVASKAKG